MNFSGRLEKKSMKVLLGLLGILGFLVVLFLIIKLLVFLLLKPTYVRIVDLSENTLTNTPSPGADIKGVSIQRTKRNKTKSYFADSVISSSLQDGENGNVNKYKNTEHILGDPSQRNNSYVSLGGGEIVVKIPIRMKSGDILYVDEIGASVSRNAENYEVYTSSSEEGPWDLQGEGTGQLTITIQ